MVFKSPAEELFEYFTLLIDEARKFDITLSPGSPFSEEKLNALFADKTREALMCRKIMAFRVSHVCRVRHAHHESIKGAGYIFVKCIRPLY